MLGHMIRAAALSLLPLLAAALPAQKTLAELQQRFVKESQELDTALAAEQGQAADAGTARNRRDALLARHTEELRAFVTAVAVGDDRWNGR